MKWVRLVRIWSFGWQGVVRNLWLSLIAIVTVALTVMSISVFTVLNVTLNETRKNFEEKLDVSIFLKESATEEEAIAFSNMLNDRDDTKEVTYVNKEKAREEFISRNQEEESFVAIINELDNPFPRYVEVKAENPQKLAEIDALSLSEPYKNVVEETSYRQTKDQISTFVNFSKFILKNSLVISAIFALIAVIVVFNIVRLAIFARRQEIQIMRYVGASQHLIRLPFVVEGIILGALAAIISLLILYVLSRWEAAQIPQYFPGATWNPIILYHQYVDVLFWSNFGIGILLSAVISYIAVHRYLKEQ